MLLHDACSYGCTVEAVSELWCLRRSYSTSASRGRAAKRSLSIWKVESLSVVKVSIFILLLFFSNINSDSKIFVLVIKRQIVDKNIVVFHCEYIYNNRKMTIFIARNFTIDMF